MIQYGKQTIEQEDIDAVVGVLTENKYLTTGPRVKLFEDQMCHLVGAQYGVAVSNGTAALHAAIYALGIGPGDEVICPAISFAASATCALYCGATPVFCDIDSDTMNINVNLIEDLITEKTKAIVVVDFAGQVPDFHSLMRIRNKYNLPIIEDAAHATGLKIDGCTKNNSSL